MNDHYYSQKPTSESRPSQFNVTIRSQQLTFHTDEGVFSKDRIDYGTSVLINQFKEPEMIGDILDVGSGYGPIGITLAKLMNDRKVYMVDVNERAIDLAKKNAAENNVSNVVILESYLFERIKGQRFASIVTNPPFRAGKQVVHQIVEESYHHLNVGGDFWVVVQKKQGAPSLKDKINETFGHVEVVKRDKGYYVLYAKKFD